MYPPKVHQQCKKLMKPFVPASKPSAGEWYCEHCDKSEIMEDPNEYNTYNNMLNAPK